MFPYGPHMCALLRRGVMDEKMAPIFIKGET